MSLVTWSLQKTSLDTTLATKSWMVTLTVTASSCNPVLEEKNHIPLWNKPEEDTTLVRLPGCPEETSHLMCQLQVGNSCVSKPATEMPAAEADKW